MDEIQPASHSATGRPAIPAAAELTARAARVEELLDELYAIDGDTARELIDQVRAIRRAVRHVDDLVHLVAHDQAGMSFRDLGAHLERYHNAAVSRYNRAARRHPGGLDEAARSDVVHDTADRADTGD